MRTKKPFMSSLSAMLLVIAIASSIKAAEQQPTSAKSVDLAKSTTNELIESLREKYGIKTIEDIATWNTSEQTEAIAKMTFKPRPQKPYSRYNDLLSVLLGFRPVGLVDLTIGELADQKTMQDAPILQEIVLHRQDCPVKFISYFPQATMAVYDSRTIDGERDAYIIALLTLESSPTLTKKPSISSPAQSYVFGKLFSYPEPAIRTYALVGYFPPQLRTEQIWETIKKDGDQWLAAHQAKTVPELKKLLSELLKRNHLPEYKNFPQ